MPGKDVDRASASLAQELEQGDPRKTFGSRIESSWPTFRRDLLFLGVYLTLRGYHSLDGDQAYRLPLLLHWFDPSLYASDPFVRSFDAFNPHRGWLALLGGLSSLAGLSLALIVCFVATFLATCRGIDRLARGTWPEQSGTVGTIAVALLLIAKAGNIGTNHLFEAMVLDRVTAMALGWNAIADVVVAPTRGVIRPAVLLGLAAFIHPSLGLQISMMVAAGWGLCAILGARVEVPRSVAIRGMVLTGLCVVPGLLVNLRSGHLLMEGLAAEEFWALSVELQSPQHMLPHLWRMPQWLAWMCYFVLAALAVGQRRSRPADERRLLLLLVVVLTWLAAAWVGIEWMRHARITVFQPFRMATLARGLALILIAGRVGALWKEGTWLARTRALLMTVGLAGDWMMVIATSVEVVTTAASCAAIAVRSITCVRRSALDSGRFPRIARFISTCLSALGFLGALSYGLVFLSRHDTEYGHRTILAVLGAWAMLRLIRNQFARRLEQPRQMNAGVIRLGMRPGYLWSAAWSVPLLAMVAGTLPEGSSLAQSRLARALVARCRFSATPIDDIERLAIWCRDNTPPTARFVGPPGPKTFRLWSQRSLVFNRAGSPYHAAGLADWFARFQDVVGEHRPAAEFARLYQSSRQRLESGYDRLDPEQLVALAARQGADHVVAAAPGMGQIPANRQSSLRLIHRVGRHAVYRVESETQVQELNPRLTSAPFGSSVR